jgi:hypothetical protein
MEYIPVVDIIEDLSCTRFAMGKYKIILYPSDEMVLECPLDYLMEEVRRKEFVNISPRKVICEWL